MNDDYTSVALLQCIGLFVSVMPEADTLRNTNDPGFKANARTREFVAASLSISVGFGLSLLDKRPRTLFVAVLMTAALIAASEFLLSANPPHETSPRNV